MTLGPMQDTKSNKSGVGALGLCVCEWGGGGLGTFKAIGRARHKTTKLIIVVTSGRIVNSVTATIQSPSQIMPGVSNELVELHGNMALVYNGNTLYCPPVLQEVA